MIGVVDYRMGNLRSVCIGLRRAGGEAELVSRPEELGGCSALVLPGVGAFGQGTANLAEQGLVGPLREWAGAGRPLLAICLGLQLLFEESEEAPGQRGLGVLPGRAARFPEDMKVPHMGWNACARRPAADASPYSEALTDGAYYYFAHSYYVVPEDEKAILGATKYGPTFASVVGRGALLGAQFHPEKSGADGLRLLERFVALAEGGGC